MSQEQEKSITVSELQRQAATDSMEDFKALLAEWGTTESEEGETTGLDYIERAITKGIVEDLSKGTKEKVSVQFKSEKLKAINEIRNPGASLVEQFQAAMTRLEKRMDELEELHLKEEEKNNTLEEAVKTLTGLVEQQTEELEDLRSKAPAAKPAPASKKPSLF